MSDSARPGGAALDPGGPGPWVPLPPAARRVAGRVAAAGAPLKEWGININYGIKTGLNDAFLIPTERREELLANCKTTAERQRTAELIRPILRGRDIRRYGYEWADLWLICIPWHFPYHLEGPIPDVSAKAERAFKELYPAVYSHMFRYKEPLLKRNKAEVGIRYEWYAMQRWGAKYWDDFFKPKIIYPNMTKFMPFVLDSKSFITNQKCFIITGEHLAYLTAFFNSSLFKFCFRDFFPELQGGTRELSKIFFDKIPVLKVSDDQNKVFQAAVEDIQHEYTSQKAQRVESMLFDLYNLTPEEREIIGSAKVD